MIIKILTPRLHGTGERVKGWHFEVPNKMALWRRSLGFKGYIVRVKPAPRKRFALYGASCGISTCQCDAVIKEVK